MKGEYNKEEVLFVGTEEASTKEKQGPTTTDRDRQTGSL